MLWLRHVPDHSVVIWPEHIVYIWFLQSESFPYTSTLHCNDIIIICYSSVHHLLDVPGLSPDGHLYRGPHDLTQPHKHWLTQVLESCLTGVKRTAIVSILLVCTHISFWSLVENYHWLKIFASNSLIKHNLILCNCQWIYIIFICIVTRKANLNKSNDQFKLT